jgi:formate C-acetyltransferase
MVIRRAKAMEHVLSNMTIKIEDGELIVGNSTSKNRGAAIVPELAWKYILEEMDTFSTRPWDRCAPISEEEKAALRDCLPYWEGKTPTEMHMAFADPVALKNEATSAFTTLQGHFMHWCHTSINYEKPLAIGIEGIIDEIGEELAKTATAQTGKITYLKGASIALRAIVNFAWRYARLAEEMAAKETDAVRERELVKIAETCRRVPARPARTFQEALQSMWFIHLGLRMEGPGLGITFGRPDQFLYPYYKADIDSGALSYELARELVALTLVKMNDLTVLGSAAATETLGGFPLMAGITIGGVTKDGKCAVNELSYMILEAEAQVGLTIDEIVVRIGEETPREFIERACETNLALRGKLKFVSDWTAIRSLLEQGRPLDYARDYILAGCFTPAVPAVCFDTTCGSFNGLLLLELALNDGVSRVSGERIGFHTGDPRRFASMDDVYEALRQQAAHVIGPGLEHSAQYRELYTKIVPQPFQSILFDGCVQKGRDFSDNLCTPFTRDAFGLAGLIDMADALAGLKLAVFDKKVCTMSEMIDALDKNFAGNEELRQFLKNAPKFGNDIEYVDSLANKVLDIFDAEIRKHRGFRNTKHGLAGATGTAHIMYGTLVGATPEGRGAGEATAEGGVSPHQGRNTAGVTGTFNSVSNLDHMKMPGGSVFNLRLNPSSLSDKEKVKKFASMLRTYCKRGGFHAQFNIVDTDMLRDAQKHPEKYRDLVVRVATYSALFTELSTALQNDIIERSEFDRL